MDKKEKTYFRAGLGLRKEMNEVIEQEYSADIIKYMKANDYQIKIDRLQFSLAKEFGFCYGVERAINYSYQIFSKFPDKRVYITGEVIHNPYVNKRLIDMGVRFLSGPNKGENKKEDLTADDVIILPAFGVTVADLQYFQEKGCVIVDTTCGSVIVVWKNVEKYAANGYTSVVHGKAYHEETKATCSQTEKYPGAHYIVILNQDDAGAIVSFLDGNMSKTDFMAKFDGATSPGFDPEQHLQKIGMANQTTMLMTETQAISDYLKSEYTRIFGEDDIDNHFKAMDTICSATQERQDALKDLIAEEELDMFIVIGGFNSSNTANLANIGKATGKPTFHIRGEEDVLSANEIRHLPGLKQEEQLAVGWLGSDALNIAITAGASTPNNVIGNVIRKICLEAGLEASLQKILKQSN
jgi:4-hydroxy-3-methylbut-2-enyl diphosphate reductase